MDTKNKVLDRKARAVARGVGWGVKRSRQDGCYMIFDLETNAVIYGVISASPPQYSLTAEDVIRISTETQKLPVG